MSITLSELVESYNKEHLEKFEEHLEKFKKIKDYKDLIYHSVFRIDPINKSSTQNNILRFNISNNLYQCLTDEKIEKKITNSLCFTDILDIVYTIRESNIARYFGPLNLYDCSLRIGVHFNIYPNKVYIHCGSLTGAKNLFKDGYNHLVKYFNQDESFPYLYIDSLPEELKNLEPHIVENFLCKFATDLEKIVLNKSSLFLKTI